MSVETIELAGVLAPEGLHVGRIPIELVGVLAPEGLHVGRNPSSLSASLPRRGYMSVENPSLKLHASQAGALSFVSASGKFRPEAWIPLSPVTSSNTLKLPCQYGIIALAPFLKMEALRYTERGNIRENGNPGKFKKNKRERLRLSASI